MKQILRYSLMVALALMVNLTANAGKIVFGELGLENGVQYLDPFDGGDFTVVFAGGGNNGKYYNTGSSIRVFGGGTMTITAKTGSLTMIQVTYDGTNKPESADVVSTGSYDVSTGIWTGSASEVVFTRPSGSGHWRIKAIATNSDVVVEVVEIDGIYYNLFHEKVAEVTSNPNKYTGSVVIPDNVEYEGNEYCVTSIGETAFNGCSGLTSVSIGNSVASIGNYAFYGCSGLTSIIIPNSVTSIGEYAFYYCSGLTSITIPNSVTSIGGYAFEDCSCLTSITIPNSVTSIGYGAFRDCTSLTSVTIPNSVTSLGDNAFSGCSGLTSVTIPNSITSIGNYVFSGCSSLTSVTIPNSITSIGNYVFSGCSSLTSVTIPNSVTSIGESAFQFCSGLTSVSIPNSVTGIGSHVFFNCSGLTSVTIPNSVTSIGKSAFRDCSGLITITIPNSVTSIEEESFQGCSSLTSITIPNSVTSIKSYAFFGCNKLEAVCIDNLEAWCKINFGSDALPARKHKLYLNEIELTNLDIPNSITSLSTYAFRYCSSLSSVRFPESMTIIDESILQGCNNLLSFELPKNLKIIKKQAFQYCSSLKNITLPATVEYIYQEAFSGCSSLAEIKALPTAPPFVYSNTFSNFSATLKVPEEGKDAYLAHDVWNKFENIQTLTGEDVNPEKCATPTIKYIGGKLLFECETEGVEFVYSITTPANATNQTGNNVDMPHTNIVSVYAKKEGYLNSDVATENIDVRGIQGDTNRDGVVTVADAVGVVNIILEKNE